MLADAENREERARKKINSDICLRADIAKKKGMFAPKVLSKANITLSSDSPDHYFRFVKHHV